VDKVLNKYLAWPGRAIPEKAVVEGEAVDHESAQLFN